MKPRQLVSILILTLMVSIPSIAVKTSIWEQKSYENFNKGTPKNISISSKGEIGLAPKLEPFSELQLEYIWDIETDSSGNIYVGTGNAGKIYKILLDGTSSLFFDSPEIGILSLAVDADDNLYAGTSPDGLIYKIAPNGNVTTLLSSEEKYVWDLEFDSSGNLYVATGTNGKIIKITPGGESSVVFDSEETHIMCLLHVDGSIYAGSEGKGIIYKIDENDHASVVYQTGLKEVHCLVMDDRSNLYAGTTTTVSPRPGEPPPRQGENKEESRIYRVTPEGTISRLWTAPVPLILSLAISDDGNLIVGTGNGGKIYSVNMGGESTYLTKCEESDVLAMHKGKNNQILLSTGNPGKIYKFSQNYVKEGTIESEAHDTRVISKWGVIKWEAEIVEGTSVTLATRSGNTAKPDNTWSEWSEELATPEGVKIASPSARFIQWRAKIATAHVTSTPVLKNVSLASVQTNVEPKIGTIKVVKGRPERRNGPPARGQEKSKPTSERTIQWAVKDQNNDKLEFSVYYKGVKETNWKLLKDELTQPMYTFDSNSMPDGRYQVKISVSDKLSNPLRMAKTKEKISDIFKLDNTQPSVGDISAIATADGKYHIECTATDDTTRIASAVYSIDSAEDWLILFPSDSIFDSKIEKFSFDTEKITAGRHTIVIKVEDAEGNVSSGKTSF